MKKLTIRIVFGLVFGLVFGILLLSIFVSKELYSATIFSECKLIKNLSSELQKKYSNQDVLAICYQELPKNIEDTKIVDKVDSKKVIFDEKNCEKIEKIADESAKDEDKFAVAVCYNKNFEPKKAIKILSPILAKDQELKRVRLELGTSHYLNRNYGEAKNNLEKIASYKNVPTNVKKNINEILNNINDIKTFGGSASFSVLKSNNINYGTYSDTVSIGNLPFVLSDSAKSLERNGLKYGLSLYKKFFLDKNFDVVYNLGYSALDYQNNKISDFSVVSPSVVTNFVTDKYKLSLNLGMSKSNSGHKPYNDIYNSDISAQYYLFNNYLIPEISLGLAKIDYRLASYALYEGKSLNRKLSLRFNIINNKKFYGYFMPYYSYQDNRLGIKSNSYSRDQYGMSYLQVLPLNYFAVFNYINQQDKYGASDPLYLKKKDSRANIFSSSLIKKLPYNTSISLSYVNTNQSAAVELYKYKKEDLTLGLSVSF